MSVFSSHSPEAIYSRSSHVRVLLLERDPAMIRVLERGLRAHGFEISTVDPESASASLAADESVRIAILDLGGANRAHVEALRRARPGLPVLLLVAGDDGAQGREVLQKPFAMEELIARIHALTRAGDEPRVTTLTAGDLRLDLLARCAWRGERLIDLPSREFALLEYFMRHPRRVLSRQQILADVWGYHLQSNGSTSNVVDVYVRYLRNRLRMPNDRSLIATVRGEGYQFNPPAEPVAPPCAPAPKAPARPHARGRTTKAPLHPAR
jgi:DNA-binding response OmpR family regulator